MKYLFLSLLFLFSQNMVKAQDWQIGVRSGIERQYSEYPRITPLLWNTEIFTRKEKKKWAMDFAISHSEYSESVTSYGQGCFGPVTYYSESVSVNEYSFTFAYQHKILRSLSKKDRIKNYIGIAAGAQFLNSSYAGNVFYPYDNIPTAETKGANKSINPYIGIAYTLSASLTKNLSINATLRPQIIVDRYFSQLISYNTANALVGLSCKL